MISFFGKRRLGASTVEVGLVLSLIALLLMTSFSAVGSHLSSLFGTTQNALGNAALGLPIAPTGSDPTPEEENTTPASCAEWVSSGAADFNDNGVNEIYPNGASTPINVYCQGAKTLIVAQYEDNPLINWNEGIQSDYDPTLTSRQSFALNSAEIPAHSKIYFGQDLASPAYCIFGTYTTARLYTLIHDDCTIAGTQYYLYRFTDSTLYNYHNPDSSSTNDYAWTQTLSLELYATSAGRQTGNDFNWAFSPNHGNRNYRGYSYLGSQYINSTENQAWTVWVE